MIRTAIIIAIALVTNVTEARSLIVDPCMSTATGPPGTVLACPAKDGDELGALGLTITVVCRNNQGLPIPGIPATDIWVIGCNDGLILCGGSGAINASGPTDANGMTTITAAFAASGCDLAGVRVVVQGLVIQGPMCGGGQCIPIKVISPDIDGNYQVDLADHAMFAMDYPSPPKAFNGCLAFAWPHDAVSLAAYARYATHHNHGCF
jgi:hypothetical protein